MNNKDLKKKCNKREKIIRIEIGWIFVVGNNKNAFTHE